MVPLQVCLDQMNLKHKKVKMVLLYAVFPLQKLMDRFFSAPLAFYWLTTSMARLVIPTLYFFQKWLQYLSDATSKHLM